MSDDVLSIQARADFSALFRESQKAADAVTSSAAQITAAMNSAGNAPNKLTFSTMEARHALMGMGEEIGVKMPRFVGSWVASLEGVGPALATAFSAIAVIGLVEVLARVPEAIDKIVSKFSGWDEAAKGAYAAQVALNKQIIEYGRALALETISNDEAGLKGAQRTQKELTDIDLKISKIRQYRAEEIAVAAAAQKELDATIVTAAHLSGRVMIQRTEVRAVEEGSDAWKTKRKVIEDAGTAVARYDNEIAKLQQVETPRKKLTLGTEQQDAAEQAAKKAEAEQERAAKEAARAQHEEILGEINDLERAAKEKTKLLTEEAKENKEANKEMDEEQKKGAEELAALKIKLMREVTAENNREVREQERITKELQRPWDQLSKSIARSMTQTTMGLIDGTMTVQKAFTKLGEGILQTMVSALAKVLAQHLTHALMVNVIEKSQLAQSIAAYLGYYSTKLATAKTAEVAQGTTDAGLAGAAAYASVMEALPFPVNIAVAPGVAAEAITATMALASFATGTDYVPRTGLALLHEGEAITPASQNRGGSGGMHVHFNVSAVDAPGVQAFFDQHGEKMARTLSRQMRRRGGF